MDDENAMTQEPNDDQPYLSRNAIIRIAKAREGALIQRFTQALEHEQSKLNGMTQLLGCLVQRFGELVVPLADIESMDPGRMFIVEQDGNWTVRVRDDSSVPVEHSVVPEFVPDESLDKEAMAKDGVDRVRFDEMIDAPLAGHS